jgi:DNA-binding response OmpR family regulator
MVPVLVVEDDARLRHLLCLNLTQRGYRVAEASTVADAVARWATAPAAVLVLDLTLPDGSGWDVIHHVAACSDRRPRLVIMSAVPPLHSQVTAFGTLTFLQKPFSVAALLRAVEGAGVDGAGPDPMGAPCSGV